MFQDSARFAIHAPLEAWLPLLYLGIVSSLLAFCAWVIGLSMGGIEARRHRPELILRCAWPKAPTNRKDVIIALQAMIYAIQRGTTALTFLAS